MAGKEGSPMRKTLKSRWKKIAILILLLITAGILLVVSVEYHILSKHRRLSKIEVTQIGLDQCFVTLPLKQGKSMHDPAVKIELYTKEGPFWIETDRTVSDLRICSCRVTGLIVFYSQFDIPDRKAKEKLLQFIRSKRAK